MFSPNGSPAGLIPSARIKIVKAPGPKVPHPVAGTLKGSCYEFSSYNPTKRIYPAPQH